MTPTFERGDPVYFRWAPFQTPDGRRFEAGECLTVAKDDGGAVVQVWVFEPFMEYPIHRDSLCRHLANQVQLRV